MHVIIVNGTTHESSGYQAAHALAEEFMQPGDSLDELSCPIEGLGFCQYADCGARCVTEGERFCPDIAALQPVLDRLDAADLIVMTTPTYCYHVAAQLKVLLEHLCWRWMRHRPNPAWFSKQAVVIATSAGAGADKPATDVADSLNWMGTGRVYVVTASMGAMDWQLADDRHRKKLLDATHEVAVKLRHDPMGVRPNIGVRARLILMKMLQRKFPTGDADQAYYREHGWL